jgi:hypothetical protein
MPASTDLALTVPVEHTHGESRGDCNTVYRATTALHQLAIPMALENVNTAAAKKVL